MLQRLLGRLVARREPDMAPTLLYDATAAQARNPAFFRQFAFPDTVLGRLDVLHLHLFVLTRHLGRRNSETFASLSQDIFDRHVEALDVALRQLGIGDLSVPKRKKRMVREFYGLVATLDRLFEVADADAIAGAVNTRFYGNTRPQVAQALARYLMSAAAGLAGQPEKTLLAGKVLWPAPLAEPK